MWDLVNVGLMLGSGNTRSSKGYQLPVVSVVIRLLLLTAVVSS
jgi:hypothetical protein